VTDLKHRLFERGCAHIAAWCAANGETCPEVKTYEGRPQFGTCAYYRDSVIHIWVDSCAAVGLVGRQWSYPGYVVDRTPYGVLAHELGHHVDKQHGARGGFRSHVWRCLDAEPMTGYCPNDNEWFAEIFRLFVTNPDLMLRLRPKVADLFVGDWGTPVERRAWKTILAESPRHIVAAENKLVKVRA
jgi:hypothetical protein